MKRVHIGVILAVSLSLVATMALAQDTTTTINNTTDTTSDVTSNNTNTNTNTNTSTNTNTNTNTTNYTGSNTNTNTNTNVNTSTNNSTNTNNNTNTSTNTNNNNNNSNNNIIIRGYEENFKIAKSNDKYVKAIISNLNISEEQLTVAYIEFNKHLQRTQDTAKTQADYVTHFRNWYIKKYRLNVKTGKTKSLFNNTL